MGNAFHKFHPYILFCYYVCSGFLILFFNHPLFLFTALLLLIFVNISHDRGKALKKWTIPLLFIGFLFALLNPLFVSRGSKILFYIGNRQITLEATIFGISMAFMLVSIIVLFVSFNTILNGNKFLFIFSKIIPRTSFLIMLAIRFVPLLHRRFAEISAVYRIRGMTIFDGKIRERAKNGMKMIQTLLTWSLEEAIQTADSMKARGYGSGKRSSYTIYKMEKRDWFSFTILILLLLICICGGALGYGKIVIYPQLGPLHFYLLDWGLFVCMSVILSFPLIVEGIEKMHWKYYK